MDGMANGKKNPSTGRKTCPTATLSTSSQTWATLELNPGLRGETSATIRLRYNTMDRHSYLTQILTQVEQLRGM